MPLRFTTPWLNDENGEFMGLMVLGCNGWRSIKDNNNGKNIFKWQVFLLEQHYPYMREGSDCDLHDYKALMMDESAFDGAAEDLNFCMWLFEVEWNWQEDKFMKTYLYNCEESDSIDEKYKKHFEKAWEDSF